MGVCGRGVSHPRRTVLPVLQEQATREQGANPVINEIRGLRRKLQRTVNLAGFAAGGSHPRLRRSEQRAWRSWKVALDDVESS